jgi:hypothetical protein
MRILGLLGIVFTGAYAASEGGWGRFSIPKPIGLHQLVTELQTSESTAVSGLSVADQIKALIEASDKAITHSEGLVQGQ